jgi:hypothetical protein
MRTLNFAGNKQDDRFLGQHLTRADVDEIVSEDADIFLDGAIVARFRKSVLAPGSALDAFNVLRKIESTTKNRGVATGRWATAKGGKYERADGTMSNFTAVPRGFEVVSNVIGNFDRYVRTPFCRQTAYTIKHRRDFEQAIPFFRSVSLAYQQMDPERWGIQAERNAKTNPAWVIPGTQFTTITVNKNWQTAVHTDQGDFKEGLSCITALRAGEYEGCELALPHLRIAFDLRTCDLLCFDSHHMHGNLPLRGKVGEFERVSLVLYVRENMHKCLSPEEEIAQAKARKLGDPLW